jgi:tRNA 2-thiouridine synthesizing protein D
MASFSLCVKAAPHTPGATHGLAFAKACIAQGHTLVRVFFYGDGVYIGLNTQVLPQGECSVSQLWSSFLTEHSIDGVLCIAAALRRGVLDDTEATRHGLTSGLVQDGFTVSGLGQWVAANCEADHVISFG